MRKYSEVLLNEDVFSNQTIEAFKELRDEYVLGFENSEINLEVYKQIYNSKKDYLKSVFNTDESTIKISRRISVSTFFNHTLEYAKEVISRRNPRDISGSIFRWGEEEKKTANDIEMFAHFYSLITNKEKELNKIEADIVLDGRRYNKGTKVSKIISIIEKKYFQDHYLKERLFNNLLPDREMNGFYLSINPLAFPYAGALGGSCYGPESSNRHSPWLMLSDRRVLVAFDLKFEKRSFILLDEQRKVAVIANTYPRSNNRTMPIELYEYFTSLGYTISESPMYQSVDGDYEYYSDMSPNEIISYKIEAMNESLKNEDEKIYESLQYYEKRDFAEEKGVSVECNLAAQGANVMSLGAECSSPFPLYFEYSSSTDSTLLSQYHIDYAYEEEYEERYECFFGQTFEFESDLGYNSHLDSYLYEYGRVDLDNQRLFKEITGEEILTAIGQKRLKELDREIEFKVSVSGMNEGNLRIIFRDPLVISEGATGYALDLSTTITLGELIDAAKISQLNRLSKGNIIIALANKLNPKKNISDSMTETYINRYMLSLASFKLSLDSKN